MAEFTIFSIHFDTFSVIQGVIQGLLYGLLALGLVLVYRTSRVINFAHGQLGVVLAVLLLKLTDQLKIPYVPSLVFCLVLAAGLGALSELTLRRLFGRPRVLVMVATIGLSQVLYLLTLLPFVSPKDLFVPYPVPIHTTVNVAGGTLQGGDLTIVIVAPLVALGVAAVFR